MPLHPRLSSRLSEAIHGDESLDPNHLDGLSDRVYEKVPILDAELDEHHYEFTMERFGKSNTSKTAYKDFLTIASSEFGASEEKFTMRVLYNILSSKKKSHNEQLSVIESSILSTGTDASSKRKRKECVDKLRDLVIILKSTDTISRTSSNSSGCSSSYEAALKLAFTTPDSTSYNMFFKRPAVLTSDWNVPAALQTHTSNVVEKKVETMDQTSSIGANEKISSYAKQIDTIEDNTHTTKSWLHEKCQEFIKSNSNNDHLFTSSELVTEITKICNEHLGSGAMLENSLIDLLGFEGIELVGDVIVSSDIIARIDNNHSNSNSNNTLDADEKMARELSMLDMDVSGTSFLPKPEQDIESLSANQRRKYELKREKEAKAMKDQYEALQGIGYNDPTCDPRTGAPDWLRNAGFTEEFLSQERSLGLEKFKPQTIEDRWLDGLAPEGTTEWKGPQKLGLPVGTKREYGTGWEEVYIPAAKKKAQMKDEDHIKISSLETWAQKAFEGTKQLNTIQSTVYDTAYNTSENLLICAPTGAGKTNIAMLTFLQIIKTNIENGELNKENVKVIYVAPMKALAQEVVAKFGERLKGLGLVVKEYTGDMQLTKSEVMESQLLVTTPEKYDVITRKGGDGSLITLVSLIIIDEVHLLADERGAVIETIVARTQRYVESSQRQVRIVGLSATLPNYKDVAKFLGVNLNSGLYYFGSEYRPVPLDQSFLGLTEKSRVKLKNQMNDHCYHKLINALEKGKQVMIFVHSRKETSSTAQALQEQIAKHATFSLFDNSQHEQYTVWKRAVDRSRSQEVQNLFTNGMGIHHAGMLRPDRTLTEQLFECGIIKVLCCTATLAWGVNLPAHTVIIKGTELYDPERGGFVDLSILDVLQIFGRAGRPQYAETGHAILITPHKSLNMYLGMLGQQAPIESNFIKALADHLNAEVVNGTVSNIAEASTWISYTFLFIRMKANPLAYGMTQEELWEDPQLLKKRVSLVKDAATILDHNLMLRYDVRSGNLGVTDLGRIASHYYIKYGTIEGFNNMLSDAHKSEKECLHALCSASEFDQLKVRPEETAELERLKKTVPMKTKSIDDTAGKVSVLLQHFCNQESKASRRLDSFTLQSDTNYIAQNAGRICRALFEINAKRGWSAMARLYLEMAKSIDKRVNMHDTPLRQFNELSREILHHIEITNSTPEKLIEMDSTSVGIMIHSQKSATTVLKLAHRLPHLYIDAIVKPITRGILRITLDVYVDFTWDVRYHGLSEPFHIWIEDSDNETIYHSEYYLAKKKQADYNDCSQIEFTIPISEPIPAQYYVRVVSDRWVGCESCVAVSFQHLILPDRMPPHTPLLDIHPVPKSALNNSVYESLYPNFSYFNPIQSQTFHYLYHTNGNVLIGAPTGSGKTITAELAILNLLNTRGKKAKTIYVAPMKALARERLHDWQRKFGRRGLELKVLELTGDASPDARALREGNILIVTPEKWDSISRGWQSQNRDYVRQVELVILDEIHLLGVDRGPVLEIIVSRMRFIATQMNRDVRFVGLSTALANPRDLADWLGIGEVGVYNFRPSVRPVPMSIHIQGFPDKNYCPRMASMNKPCYAAIMEHSPTKPTLIFVSSRRQTRLTALDLIAYCAADLDQPKRFLSMPEEEMLNIVDTIRDGALRDTLVFGVGIHHAGLDNNDRLVVEDLFLNNKIQVLVCTSTLAWGVNLPCHLVIVKGTEFYDGKINRYVDMPVTDVLQMMGRAGRPQFDDSAVAVIMAHEPKKNFYKKFLHEPFPVESSLQNYLHDHLNAEIANGTLNNLDDCIEFLTWTYFFRRLVYNPSYYRLIDASTAGIRTHLITMIKNVCFDLQAGGCLQCIDPDDGHIIEDDREKVEGNEASTHANSGANIATLLPDPKAVATDSSVHCSSEVTDVQVEHDEQQPITHSAKRKAKAAAVAAAHQEQQSTPGQVNFEVKPTHLGQISSYYYLNYKTIGHFEKSLDVILERDWANEMVDRMVLSDDTAKSNRKKKNKDNTKLGCEGQEALIRELSLVICKSFEFSELPVRHNEDGLNRELAQNLPWNGVQSDIEYESPNIKAFLLLQAHFIRIKLPISDYINDTKSVLDQIPRVLGALVEVAVSKEAVHVIEALAILSQMVAQGCMYDTSGEIMQLPYVNQEVSSWLEVSHGIVTMSDFNVNGKSHGTLNKSKIDSVTNNLQSILRSDAACKKLSGALRTFPFLSINSIGIKFHSNTNCENKFQLFDLNGKKVTTLDITAIDSSSYQDNKQVSTTKVSCKAQLQMNLQNHATMNGTNVRQFSNGRHHKPKDGSWWVLITYTASTTDANTFSLFKRIQSIRSGVVDISWDLSSVPINTKLRLHVKLMSDTFLGAGIETSVPLCVKA
jgi:activating signal cointegrator complex subunit 3